MLTILTILLAVAVGLGCVVVFTDGVCIIANVLYTITSTLFLILGCFDIILSGDLSLLFEYGTGIEIFTIISGVVWAFSVIVISNIWCWSQEDLPAKLFFAIFILGGFFTYFLYSRADFDMPEIEMRKTISSASSIEYTEENLYYRISNDIGSRAFNVLDIVKEKDQEDLYIVNISGFTKKLKESDFNRIIGHNNTHVSANYVTFELVGYTSPGSVGYKYTATELLLSDASLDRNYYVTNALDYFNGDYEEGPHKLWRGDLSDLKGNGYTLYSHSRNEN